MNRGLRALALGLLLPALNGCQSDPQSQPLRSLERSGDIAFVCLGPDGRGRSIEACPDHDTGQNRLLALVTQTLRGEVAVVDLTRDRVLDLDPSSPGYNFLPVGANPVSIAATPGGEATFVAVAEVGQPGIYGLPTSCAREPRGPNEPRRELTLWPACALPVAPGAMTVLIDPAGPDGVRPSCDAAPAPLEPSAASAREYCPVDLGAESSPAGRRKLAVALPDLGQIAVIDAQELLDRPLGSFAPCSVERWVPLDATLPPSLPPQQVPPELEPPLQCEPAEQRGGPAGPFRSRPSDMALASGRLFVADQGAPLVHVLDVSDPCAPAALPPLLPMSYEDPSRVVRTKKLAVSPVTTKGEQFVYAVDDAEGSLMVFDVSAGSTNRTPVIRPGGARLPAEPPDRVRLSAPVQDVVFAKHDVPIADPATGVAVIGTLCDPDPAVPLDEPAALYRPASDLSRGAGPRRLRGVFAFAALSNGQVVVVDVEDWDAPCRRPVQTNAGDEEDFRGCAGDPDLVYRLPDGRPTVTDEVSCDVVQPHRVRSAAYLLSRSGRPAQVPSLRAFPRLTLPPGASSDDRRDVLASAPKLLAAEFDPVDPDAPPLAEVFVGRARFSSDEQSEVQRRLILSPSLAERYSLALPLAEPRAFPQNEDVTTTFEGQIMEPRKAGFLSVEGAVARFEAPDGAFCDRGVHDLALAGEMGAPLIDPERVEALGLTSEAALSTFAERHVDYVQITSPVPGADDPHWGQQACGATFTEQACRALFGSPEVPQPARDLAIVAAYQTHLEIEPRDPPERAAPLSEQEREQLLSAIQCCFPGGLSYTIRGGRQWIVRGAESGFRHDVFAAPGDLRCTRAAECNPRERLLRSRVIEVSSTACEPGTPEEPSTCAVGAAVEFSSRLEATGEDEDGDGEPDLRPVWVTEPSLACTVDFGGSPGDDAYVRPGGPGAACIFQSLTERFVIYRGNRPSLRDQMFRWQVGGGFVPLFTSLVTTQSSATLPQSIEVVPGLGRLVVADGASQGLAIVGLDRFELVRLYQ